MFVYLPFPSYFCSIIIIGEAAMELQTVKIGHENIVPSGARVDGISIRRLGIAKVLWRKVDWDVPQSEVIKDGRKTFSFRIPSEVEIDFTESAVTR